MGKKEKAPTLKALQPQIQLLQSRLEAVEKISDPVERADALTKLMRDIKQEKELVDKGAAATAKKGDNIGWTIFWASLAAEGAAIGAGVTVAGVAIGTAIVAGILIPAASFVLMVNLPQKMLDKINAFFNSPKEKLLKPYNALKITLRSLFENAKVLEKKAAVEQLSPEDLEKILADQQAKLKAAKEAELAAQQASAEYAKIKQESEIQQKKQDLLDKATSAIQGMSKDELSALFAKKAAARKQAEESALQTAGDMLNKADAGNKPSPNNSL